MIGLAIYVIGFPILLWLLAFAHKKFFIDRPMQNRKKRVDPRTLPEPKWGKWWQRIRFTMTDKRDYARPPKKKQKGDKGKKENPGQPKKSMKRNLIYWGLYLIGLAIAALGFLLGDPNVNTIIASAVFFYSSAMFGIRSSSPLLTKRENMMKQMHQIASSRMQVDSSVSPYSVIRITEWRDPEYPSRIEIDIPTTFDQSGEEGFQKLFNQKFGRVTAWVPDTKYSEGIMGWDYEVGVLTLRSVPPLPARADWHEKYVLHPAIAWCFFPLALGVENGVKIDFGDGNPPEHILGIDFSGEQEKVGKANGAEVAPSLVRSPMALVAGGTGGGKSLHKMTPVLTLEPIENS